MGWKTVDAGTPIDFKKKPVGEQLIGTITGSKQIETPLGKQMIWHFVDEEEMPFSVYGFTNLNRGLEGIKTGTLLRLTYKGTVKTKTKFGMKDVHQVVIEMSDEPEAPGEPAEEIPF